LKYNIINQVCLVVGKQAVSCVVWLQKRPGANPEMVKTYSAGDSFGELALLYDAPRAATVKVRLSLFLFPLTL
jgi:CRP-like cAMP-binding protein